jgi:phospholipase/lecithinase/hemolysin
MTRNPFGRSELIVGTALFFLLVTVVSACRAGVDERGPTIGVLGDSYSDEYQFYPPDRSTAENWVEILARTRGLNFGRYSTQSRGEPRNQGFEFNWARSDATSTDLIKSGQLTGLAEQVAGGAVSVVVIFIGGNDFIYALQSKDAAILVQSVQTRAQANLRVAVDTILKASPRVCVLIATLPSILELPEFTEPLERGLLSPSLALAFNAAIERYNREVRILTLRNPRAVLLDLALLERLAPRPDRDHVRIYGRTLDRGHPQNRPDHVFLADARHVGTLPQAVMANLVINTLNSRFQTRIKPLGLAEIDVLTRPPSQFVKRDPSVERHLPQ